MSHLRPIGIAAGVDGSRGGWFVALLRFSDDEIETVQHRLCRSFNEVNGQFGLRMEIWY